MQALKKMVKQEDAAKDGDDSGGDLIRAVHGASSATATNEVQLLCRAHAGCVTCLTRL